MTITQENGNYKNVYLLNWVGQVHRFTNMNGGLFKGRSKKIWSIVGFLYNSGISGLCLKYNYVNFQIHCIFTSSKNIIIYSIGTSERIIISSYVVTF